jgi:hypothetical protein
MTNSDSLVRLILAIGLAGMLIAVGVSVAVSLYQVGQCRLVGLEKGFTVDQIQTLCK